MVYGSNAISVVIPCYNSEKYIARCIRSIIRQTVKPLEIIVVDDGSNDRTAQIARKFPVKVVRHKYNRGLAEARNTGVRKARGNIIFFVDSDCEMYPNNLEYALSDFRKDEIDAVCGQEVATKTETIIDKYRARFPQSWGPRKIINPPFLWGLCSAFRKDSLLKAGLFSSLFRTNGEDVDISLRMKKMGYRLLYDPRIKVYHLRTDNIMSFIKSTYRGIYFGKLARIRNTFKQNGAKEVIKYHAIIAKDRIITPMMESNVRLLDRISFGIVGILFCLVGLMGEIAAFNARRLEALVDEGSYRKSSGIF